jgi:hypothetical protein
VTQGRRRQAVLFEKKNQKTFDTLGTRWIHRAPQLAKVFASFSKKKRFLS